ncbi:MAG: CoA pyrophosphatase [Syntrophobacterales bacterium]|nr:CoA pyrophosphatase [Syntrophobacterales bacterium]
MERMRENQAWVVKNASNLYGTLSEILYRDFPLDIFKDIARWLSSSNNKVSEEVTAVLFLVCPEPITSRVGRIPKGRIKNEELGIALNKRSRHVVQPGDLCFPGGRIEKPFDNIVSYFGPFFLGGLSKYPHEVRQTLFLLSVTALREAWEEVRLNPFKVRICGVLPPYKLVMFHKTIVPVVGLLETSVFMRGNSHEVEKVVWIPFSELLDGSRYARYRLYNYPRISEKTYQYHDFLCFIHQDGVATEILWGATFRMVMDFLSRFFEFLPPSADTLPIVPGVLSDRYLTQPRY